MRIALGWIVLALGLSGCAVVDAAGTVADAGVSVAGAAVDVTAGAAKTVVHTVTPSDDDAKKD